VIHSQLEKHMKFHYGGPVHLCEVPGCGKTFTTTGNINRHMKSQHHGAAALQKATVQRSPTTTDAWLPEPQLVAPQCRLKRAWSTGTNPLPAESSTNFNRPSGEQLEALDENVDNLSALLVDTGLDSSGWQGSEDKLMDDVIRFHVHELGFLET
jgi:hypothetical protein